MHSLGADSNSKPTYRNQGPPKLNSAFVFWQSRWCVTITAPIFGKKRSSSTNRGKWNGRRICCPSGEALCHIICSLWNKSLPGESWPHCWTFWQSIAAANRSKTTRHEKENFIFRKPIDNTCSGSISWSWPCLINFRSRLLD